MYTRRLTRLLLLPSLLSGTVVTGFALGTLGYNAWSYISENQFFYERLFGAYGIKTYFWQNSLQATAWENAFLSSTPAYYVLVAGVAIVAGLTVFTLLQWFSLVFRGGSLILQELRTPDLTHRQIMLGLMARLGLRAISLVGWAVYAAFFFSTVLPFVIVLNQLGVTNISAMQPQGWLACSAAALLFILTLHLHIVFLRLALLRPRIFGGDRAIQEAESMSDEHGLG